MIEIDGGKGEGGGQILRTAVSMSAVTGKAVKIKNIRAKRKNPGIRPEQLNAIDAVREISGARVSGLFHGSESLEFYPGKIQAKDLRIDVGTAGSATLVLQGIMICATQAKKPFGIEITGGTDVSWSPSVDYLRFVTLGVLERFGYQADLSVLRRGYFPRGGGQVIMEFRTPFAMRGICLTDSGEVTNLSGVSHASRGLESRNVAGRQANAAKKVLGVSFDVDITEESVESLGLGSGLTLWSQTEKSVLGACGYGKPGRSSEDVGSACARELADEIDSNAALDMHMADQIVPYLALFGGSVQVSRVTQHTRTNIDVVNRFGFDVRIEEGKIVSYR